jgi:hypothetical protein
VRLRRGGRGGGSRRTRQARCRPGGRRGRWRRGRWRRGRRRGRALVEPLDLLAHVAAGREGALAGAGQGDGADRLIGVQLVQGFAELSHQFAIEGVEFFRPVQRDQAHCSAAFHQHQVHS